MFTGLIQEMGTLQSVTRTANGVRWAVRAPLCAPEMTVGDSINIAGACQTAEAVDGDTITGTAIPETLRVTTFGQWKAGLRINLELALRVGDRLGGHFVSGHIDATGTIARITKADAGHVLEITYPSQYDPWVVNKGSVALDGVSLTIAECGSGRLTVALIPETLTRTTLGRLKVGDAVNMEFDQLVKAVVAQTAPRRVDEALLTKAGF